MNSSLASFLVYCVGVLGFLAGITGGGSKQWGLSWLLMALTGVTAAIVANLIIRGR